jgi:hypothetical protein
MTRNGKIARLPREIREELNRRLDDGEQGVRVLGWLNGLPEVKKVLEEDFEGRAILPWNLTDWRKGGFAEWREQQERLALTKEFLTNGTEFGTVSPEVVKAVEIVTMAHYAAATQRSNCDPKEDPDKRFERLRKSLHDVGRFRRCEQAGKRLELEQKWLELEWQKSGKAKASRAAESFGNEIRSMTEEEKTQLLTELQMPENKESPGEKG